jgi:hypothetical protein
MQTMFLISRLPAATSNRWPANKAGTGGENSNREERKIALYKTALKGSWMAYNLDSLWTRHPRLM